MICSEKISRDRGAHQALGRQVFGNLPPRVSFPSSTDLEGGFVMPRRMWVWCVAVLLAPFAAGPSRAALVVSIGSSSVAQGSTGSVEVDITNNGPAAVEINNFAIQLVIAPMSPTLTQLAFTAPTAQQLGYLADSNYIFPNNSADAVPPPPSSEARRRPSTITIPSTLRTRPPTVPPSLSRQVKPTCWPSCRLQR